MLAWTWSCQAQPPAAALRSYTFDAAQQRATEQSSGLAAPRAGTEASGLPSTAGVQVLVKANQMQASLADVAPELATLALLVLGYGAWAPYRLLHRRPALSVRSRAPPVTAPRPWPAVRRRY